VLEEGGFAAQVPVVGPLMGLYFADAPVTNYDEARAACGNGVYPRFFHAMLPRGVAFAPGAYEVAFPSLAHTRDDIERTADLARAAIAELPST
ncbi:MAG: aspartate aminotransferase family protein, partial [Actinobacteria bacterium]|nr:aspartate aminotransferase family protein [Actinomycetota bacterium]